MNNADFAAQLIEFTKEYESPTAFWKWSAYATIAAVLRNNVYFKYGLGEIYPNIYAVLLADSAEYRKDAGLKLASELLRELSNTKIIEGRASFQAIIDDLAHDKGNKKGFTPRGGACIIIAPELAAFFVADPQLIQNLTNWYEFRDEHQEKLRGTGTVTIKNRCINLLAASNETFLRDVYDTRAMYGGLLRRTFLIRPDETRNYNSLVYEDLDLYDKTPLVKKLAEIANLKGRVAFTTDAARVYDDWYGELYKSYKTHPDRTGVLQSMHTSVLKLAIIIAASYISLEISEEIIKRAILEVTALRGNYEAYAMTVGKSDLAKVGTTILNYLWQAKDNKLSREDILIKVWTDIDAENLDKLIDTLVQAGLLNVVQIGRGVGYAMTEKCKDKFRGTGGNQP
jgi:hypothetical protein